MIAPSSYCIFHPEAEKNSRFNLVHGITPPTVGNTLAIKQQEEGIFLVKGISRRVIVVDSPDPHIFEQAIFIVRNDAASGGGGVTSQQLVDQAVRIARNYTRTHGGTPSGLRRKLTPLVSALLGAAAIGLVWLVVCLI